jgi:AraC-like DNA-binding protein
MNALEGLRRLVLRHADSAVGASLVETDLPGVRLVYSRELTATAGDTVEPTFALVVAGEKRTVLGDRTQVYGAGQFLVAAVDLPVTGAVTRAPFAAVVLRLDPATITDLLLHAGMPTATTNASAGLAVSDAGPALIDAVRRLLGLLDRPRDAPALAPLYEREVLWRLLTGEQGALVRSLGAADGSVAHVGRAIGWLRANYHQPLRVEDLADLAAMSQSAFRRHFRQITKLTPLQYQQQLRLNEARALLAAGAGTTKAVSAAVGYSSTSQFSREYRRLFGEPPSRDAARLRSVIGA